MKTLTLLLALLIAAPADAARSRIVGPRAAAPTQPVFDPSLPIDQLSGIVSRSVTEREQTPASATLTVRTWGPNDAPWTADWLLGNQRYSNGRFEVIVYRARFNFAQGPPYWPVGVCRVATLWITAAPNHVETLELPDPSGLLAGDTILYETGFKGYEIQLDVRDANGTVFFTGLNNFPWSSRVPDIPWPADQPPQWQHLPWTQGNVTVGCD